MKESIGKFCKLMAKGWSVFWRKYWQIIIYGKQSNRTIVLDLVTLRQGFDNNVVITQSVNVYTANEEWVLGFGRKFLFSHFREIFAKILFSLFSKISSHFRKIFAKNFAKMLILKKSIFCVVFKTLIGKFQGIFFY